MVIRTRAYGEDQFGFVVENDDGSVHSQSPMFPNRKTARAEARKQAKDLGGDVEVVNEDES